MQLASQGTTTPNSFPQPLLHTRRSTADKRISSRMQPHVKAQETWEACLLRKTVTDQVMLYSGKISLAAAVPGDSGIRKESGNLQKHHESTWRWYRLYWQSTSQLTSSFPGLVASWPELCGPCFQGPPDQGTTPWDSHLGSLCEVTSTRL